jgi:hypothetical protein
LTLSKLSVPIEIVLVSHNPDGTKTLLAIKHVDWRFVLAHGAINVSLELSGMDVNNKLSVGLIQVHFVNNYLIG